MPMLWPNYERFALGEQGRGKGNGNVKGKVKAERPGYGTMCEARSRRGMPSLADNTPLTLTLALTLAPMLALALTSALIMVLTLAQP